MNQIRSSEVLLALLVVLGALACDNDLASPVEVPLDEIIQLFLPDASPPADGVSRVEVSAQIPADSTTRSVTFGTTKGSFVGATSNATQTLAVQVDTVGRASATLVTDTTPGVAVVSATVSSNTARGEIEFERAHARGIELESDRLRIKADGSTVATLIARLQRGPDEGSVSVGTSVFFEATRDGRPVGRFRGLFDDEGRTDANGMVQATYAADTGVRPGTVTVTARTDTDGGGTKEARVELIVEE